MIFPEKYRIHPPGLYSQVDDNGVFHIKTVDTHFKKVILQAVASNGEGWDHVSVTVHGLNRCPSWEEMSYVKGLFWSDDECVVQYHPPQALYVNQHKYCLHLWRKQGYEFPLPDSILVGVKK